MLQKILTASLLLAPACVAPFALAADGDPDPSFGVGGIAYLSLDGVEGHELRTAAAIALPDGKLLFGGSRNKLIQGNPDPHTRASLARMNADGSADTAFGSDSANPGILVLGDLVPGTGIQQVEGLAVLGTGAIVAAGTGFAFGPASGFVTRLDADGQPDLGFGSDGLVTIPHAYIHAMAVDSQGRIVVGGERQSSGEPTVAFVARFGADGSLDRSFGASADGIATLVPVDATEGGYLSTLTIGADDVVIAGGAFEAYGAGSGTDYSLARFTADGLLDTTFAATGWRTFPLPDSASTYNGIAKLLVLDDGRIAFAGYTQNADGGVEAVLGQVLADGTADTAFGAAATPGFAPLAVVPDAGTRYPTALVRQDDGKLLVAISYSGSDNEDYLLARTGADGVLDASFGSGGLVDIDPAPTGVYSDLTALTLQNGQPILAGATKRDASSWLVDLGVVRLHGGGDDRIFADGFEIAAAPSVSTYDDLAEGFEGPSFSYGGVAYSEANGIGGVFPDGSTFTAADVGNDFIVEDAAIFYPDFPDYGSAPNSLTFGTSYIPGDNFSIGAFVRATLTLDHPASAATVDLAYYEGGPWGGIELHMDAYAGDALVDSASFTLASGGDRDHPATNSLSVSGAAFDTLKLYATYDGQPSAPRLMIDDLALTPAN